MLVPRIVSFFLISMSESHTVSHEQNMVEIINTIACTYTDRRALARHLSKHILNEN